MFVWTVGIVLDFSFPFPTSTKPWFDPLLDNNYRFFFLVCSPSLRILIPLSRVRVERKSTHLSHHEKMLIPPPNGI